MTKTPQKKTAFDDTSLNKVKRAFAIGQRIKAARQKNNLSQKALGEQLGITAGAVGQWEIGTSSPTVATFDALCGALGVTRDWLMTGEEAPERYMAQTLEEQKMLELVRQLEQDDRGAFLRLLALKTPKIPGKPGRKPHADREVPKKGSSRRGNPSECANC